MSVMVTAVQIVNLFLSDIVTFQYPSTQQDFNSNSCLPKVHCHDDTIISALSPKLWPVHPGLPVLLPHFSEHQAKVEVVKTQNCHQAVEQNTFRFKRLWKKLNKIVYIYRSCFEDLPYSSGTQSSPYPWDRIQHWLSTSESSFHSSKPLSGLCWTPRSCKWTSRPRI